jgi:1-acyl-sn-glycerol-3-phosphate acyltransferase
MLYAIMKSLAVAVMRVLFRLESRGREYVPRRGPTLVVANHSSVLDPPIVGGCAPRPLSFLAKAELFDIPLFGRLIRGLNARPIRRGGADPSALRLALRLLGENQALLVFPEGTRGPEGVLREPKTGAGMLAVMSGATVVPAYVSGSGRVWPKGRRFPRPGKVRVVFGPPLKFERQAGVDRKEQYAAASRAMMDAIADLMVSATGGIRERSKRLAMREGPRETRHAASGAGANAQSPSKYIHGRKGQHEQG